MRAAAVAHAAARVDQALALGQLIDEVRLLRVTLLRLLLAAEGEQQGREAALGMAERVPELAPSTSDSTTRSRTRSSTSSPSGSGGSPKRRTGRRGLARESDQRKSEFLAVLSHELRNPLAPTQNALHILDRAVSPRSGP